MSVILAEVSKNAIDKLELINLILILLIKESVTMPVTSRHDDVS